MAEPGRPVKVRADAAELDGDLHVSQGAAGVVLFAHGSGSSRHSPRNRQVARALNEAGFGTLLMDLLTADEEAEDLLTARLRFDIPLLSERLVAAIDWLGQAPATRDLPIGCFGASTGAAAALVAAASRPQAVRAVVSRGGRPDLAGSFLGRVEAPTLLIVGGKDSLVIALNQDALTQLNADKKLEIVPGATHLFEEPGALEKVATLATEWFQRWLAPRPAQEPA